MLPQYFCLSYENRSRSRPVFWRLKKKIAVASCGLQVANINLYLIYFTWAGKKCGSVILDRENRQLRFRRKDRAFSAALVLSCNYAF